MAQSNPRGEVLKNTIITLSDGISVRPNRPGDEPHAAKHANNRKIWQNLASTFPSPYLEEDSKYWINFSTDPVNWLPTLPYVQFDGESEEAFTQRLDASKIPRDYGICHNDQIIGSIGLIADPLGQKHILRLGYWLGEEYWGRGIMSNVVKAFVPWAFDNFPWLLRLEVDAYGHNYGSQAVLKKAGFQVEAIQKFKYLKEGKYIDLVAFSMLRPGWNPEGENTTT